MKRITPTLTILTLAVACALPLQAGIYYKARTTTGDRQGDMVVESWVDGASARIEFTESDNPLMPEGTWLVTTDAGRTMYLVNPQDKTYSKWDLEAMLNTMSNMMEAMGPMMGFEIQNPKVETLVDEPGGKIAGYSTRHYKYRTTYDLQMKIMGMKRSQSVNQVQEMWLTNELDAEALNVWLMRDPPDMGDTGLKELIEAEMAKLTGFPLKTVMESVTTGQKGKESITRSTTVVEEVGERSIDGERFRIDPSYRETAPAFDPSGGQDEGDQRGLFGRKRGKG